MKKEVGLEYFSKYLRDTHIKIKLNFLNDLLKNASDSDAPHRDEKFAQKIGCPMNKNKKSATTIYGWIKGYRTIPLSKISKLVKYSDYSWKDVEENLTSIKAGIRNGEIKPNFPIVIDSELGSIIGHILGDGSISERFHSVFYSNSDTSLLKEFNNFMKKIFGLESRKWIQKRKSFEEKFEWLTKVFNLDEIPEKHCVGLFYPKICCDILYSLFGKFAEGKKKKITSQIMNANKEFKKGLLRAFFDDEGSVRSDNYMVRIHQDRKDILESLITILKEFNINPQIIREYKKKDKSRYYFNITGFKEYSNFFKIIGCTSPKKKREFELLINKVKNSKYQKNKTPV